MDKTLYRRPLPDDAIPFASAEGRRVFAEALAAGGLEGYFRLAEQFHTQSDPAYCGLGSLVVALNALGIDPGRLWKGPWRWFSEELLDCCVPLAEVRERGLSLDELACLARCNGAEVDVVHADGARDSAWRDAVAVASPSESVLIAAYDRASLGQTGAGHFSPIGGYHAARDLVLVMDVARFKYPPHWVSAHRLWLAMHALDPATGRARGFMRVRPRPRGISVAFSFTCHGASFQDLVTRLRSIVATLDPGGDAGALARAVLPLAGHLDVRTPRDATHEAALRMAREALHALPAYEAMKEAVGGDLAERVSMLLLASVDLLPPAQRDNLASLIGTLPDSSPLAVELSYLRAQVAALEGHGSAPLEVSTTAKVLGAR